MRRLLAFTIAFTMLATACAAEDEGTTSATEPEPNSTTPAQVPGPASGSGQTPTEPSAQSTVGATSSVMRCEDAARIEAPDTAYGESPIYVANEMPVEAVDAWAGAHPGYETLWIDRDHNGWITVAFSQDADVRRAEIPSLFPDAGVVVVEVDWTMAELENLQRRVTDHLLERGVDSFGSGVSVTTGLVSIDVGVLTGDIIALVESEFGRERVCVSGRDPSTVPAPGPQPDAGANWRLLLAAQGTGEAYRTGIATDERTLSELWETLSVGATIPDVDFETEVAIWFGAVYGSGCENIRLDAVVVEGDTVHADIVLVDPPAFCNDDANPFAFVVAVERAVLPVGPFRIQLDADGPPAGAPEERTYVDVDLSQPGAVARAGDLSVGTPPPPDSTAQSGDFLEPDIAHPYSLYLHCGHTWLGEFNGFVWRTDQPAPPSWNDLVGEIENIELEIVLREGPDPRIEAVGLDEQVVYRPTTDDIPGCD